MDFRDTGGAVTTARVVVHEFATFNFFYALRTVILSKTVDGTSKIIPFVIDVVTTVCWNISLIN